MKYVLDSHSHTLASGHAYNTIREMACAAKEVGLELLAITEHAPQMPGTCHDFYFSNLKVVSRQMCGVELLLGVELNILDFDGNVDLSNDLLKRMDIVIASMHTPCYPSGTMEENTRAYINVMKNPYVNIIGHPDDNRYPVDMEALVLASKEHRVLLELNNSSLNPNGARQDARGNDITMLTLCKKHQVPIVIGSDAHTDSDVGRHDLAFELIKEVDFPEELIINRSVSELKKYLRR
ncbi:phosphatase [Candidatus Galacturonibacter soehngenii]|uniref:Phosphatase n=1 Tax=Candidatus Galacturonatibacter soehngenii TaxID=2307010 RepID=A0A7V7QK35_9FIRM|nr:phosphatase [Candidatus Galacturonibacter soehngenii]KAB1438047.1 phosphatase [Candidatus Galacturonibacter soehngenii]MBA4688776.1 phosphatase [Candidatus Galacturonibacter soehngenii]